jgi:hypothetical protein
MKVKSQPHAPAYLIVVKRPRQQKGTKHSGSHSPSGRIVNIVLRVSNQVTQQTDCVVCQWQKTALFCKSAIL